MQHFENVHQELSRRRKSNCTCEVVRIIVASCTQGDICMCKGTMRVITGP